MSWFDLSPMRPDEYARTDAERWTEAVELRNAIYAGRSQARDEHAALSEAGRLRDESNAKR